MKFLVFQHIACEHPGIFRDLMTADGVTWDAIELDEGETIPSFDGYDALLVMGGPMDVWERDANPWLEPEIDAIRRWVTEGKPYLGFCLGHQLLAVALEGEVGPSQSPEIGVLSVNLTEAGKEHWLFEGCAESFDTLQWHSAEVTKMPADAIALADSPHCAVNAMAFGDKAASVQFHVELTPTTVSEWGDIPAYANALEKAKGPGAMQSMIDDSDAQMAAFNAMSRQLYRNFTHRIKPTDAD